MNAKILCKAGLAALAGLVVAGTAVQAQIAAPRLNDTFPAAGSAFNPAVLPWHPVFRVGVTVITDNTVDFTPGGGSTIELASGDGAIAQLRLAGESLAFAAETGTTELDNNPAVLPAGTSEFTNSLVGLAGRLSEALVIGAGVETAEFSNSGTGEASDSGQPLVGATWRPGEVLFVGGTYGEETVEESSPPAAPGEGERAVARIGVGLFSRSDDSGYHVEVYREERATLELRDAAGTLQRAEEEESVGATLEGRLANFLLGVELLRTTTDEFTPPATVTTEEEDEQILSVGWIPQEGLAFSAIHSRSERTDNASDDVLEVFFTGFAVAWLF